MSLFYSILSYYDWRASLLENILNDLCGFAKNSNRNIKIYLTEYGASSWESFFIFGQNSTRISKLTDGVIPFSEFHSIASGNVVKGVCYRDMPAEYAGALMVFLWILMVIGVSTMFEGVKAALAYYGDGPGIVFDIAVVNSIEGLVIGAFSLLMISWYNQLLDPPGDTLQQRITATVNSWQTSNTISKTAATEIISDLIINDIYLTMMQGIPFALYQALDQSWPSQLPRMINIFGFQINVFQNIYNILYWHTHNIASSGLFIQWFRMYQTLEVQSVVSNWLDSLKIWDFYPLRVLGFDTQTTSYPATVNYRINIQNKGTQADQYSIDVNLPSELTSNPGVRASWTIISGGTLKTDGKIQIEAGATASINIAVGLPSGGLSPATHQLSVDVSGQAGDENDHPIVHKRDYLTLIVSYQAPPVAIISSTNYEIYLDPATPVNDYQVKVNFDATFPYASCKSDGGDIRFYTMAGSKIPYWIESWNQGASHSSTIWVKVPAAGTSKIKMMFGDPTLPSESNGYAVFDFFDDFSGTSIDTTRWNVIQQLYSSVTVSEGFAHLKTDGGAGFNCWMNTIQGFSDIYNVGIPVASNSFFHDGGRINSSVNQYDDSRIFTLSKNAWSTLDLDRVDPSHSVATIDVGGSISRFEWMSATGTFIPSISLPITFMTYGGPIGNSFAGQITSKQTFSLGYAMHMRSYTSYSFTSSQGAPPAIINVDWVCIRKGQANDPVATVRQITEQFTTGRIGQDHVISVSTLVSPSTAALNIDLSYPADNLNLGIVDPAGNIVLSTMSNVQYSKTAFAENWTIYRPIEGSYTIYVLGTDIPSISETFSLHIESEAFLALDIFASMFETSKTILDNEIASYLVLVENLGITSQDVTISTEGVDLASVAFEVDGEAFDGTITLAPDSSVLVNVILTPIADGIDNFSIHVSPVNGNSTFYADCSVANPDTTPPEVTDIQINWIGIAPDGGIYVDLSLTASDPESGIDTNLIRIQVGNNSVMRYQDGSYLIRLPSSGTYLFNITVPNTRWRFGSLDPLWTSITYPVVVDLPIVVNILEKTIAASPVSIWRDQNKKMTMLNQIDVVKTMIETGNFHDAYEKLLHDIKPKLTGLKTDENEQPWGNGIFKNPWVTDVSYQAIFRSSCNILMMELLKFEQMK